MSAYDNTVDAVIFKSEDEGVGPVWVRRGGQKAPYEANSPDGHPTWFTLKGANRIAKDLGLPLFEV